MNKTYNKLVSVIIPTYNRFESLLYAINSIKNQTYKNIEIIVINDNSTDMRYYNYKFNDIIIIHLNKNSKTIYNYTCAAYARNYGIRICNGNYICFLDDDDYFLPNKVEEQINILEKNNNIHMCCSDSYIGNGNYISNNIYKKFNGDYFNNFICKKLKINILPNIINYNLIEKHNMIITSSVMFSRYILTKTNLMSNLPNGLEDYNYWLRMLKYTDCYYINKALLYYDAKNYKK